jgi:hypothetical protein
MDKARRFNRQRERKHRSEAMRRLLRRNGLAEALEPDRGPQWRRRRPPDSLDLDTFSPQWAKGVVSRTGLTLVDDLSPKWLASALTQKAFEWKCDLKDDDAKSGRAQKDQPWHDFIMGLDKLYQKAFKPKRIGFSRSTEGGDISGPRARFIQAVLERLDHRVSGEALRDIWRQPRRR